MSARRLRSLIRGLPLESAFARGVLGSPGPGSWGNVEELLAGSVEVTHGVMRATIAGFGMLAKSPPKVPEPLTVPRPASASGHTRRRRSSRDELRRFFGAGRVVYTPKARPMTTEPE